MNAESPLPDSHRRRGSWKKTLAIILTLLAIIFGALVAYDPKLEPYDDLAPRKQPSPDVSTNGFYFLYGKWAKVPKADTKLANRLHRIRYGYEPMDAEFLAGLRKGAENAASDLHTALALPEWGALPNRPDREHVWFGQLMPAARVVSMDAWIAAQSGDVETALRLARDLQRLAGRMIANSGSLVELSVGDALQSLSAELSCDLLARLPGEDRVLAALEEMWRQDTMTPDVLQGMLRESLAAFREAYLSKNPHSAGYGNLADIRWPAIMNLFLKKNQTVNRCHSLARYLEKQILLPSATKEEGAGAKLVAIGEARTKLSLNFIGDRITGEWIAMMRIISENIVPRALFTTRAMRLRLALERWKTAHSGNLPETLAELVPDYLPEVPADPWNGKPLLWDPKTAVISAVGPNWEEKPPVFLEGYTAIQMKTPAIRLRLPVPPPPPP